jgi:hypothetical protein
MRPWWGGLPLGAAQDKGASDDCVWKGVQTAGRGRRTLLSQVLNVLHGRGCTSDAALLYSTVLTLLAGWHSTGDSPSRPMTWPGAEWRVSAFV